MYTRTAVPRSMRVLMPPSIAPVRRNGEHARAPRAVRNAGRARRARGRNSPAPALSAGQQVTSCSWRGTRVGTRTVRGEPAVPSTTLGGRSITRTRR